MERISVGARARTVIGVIAVVLLVMSFALVALLINRPQANAGPGAGGCPASTSGFVASSLVGASFSISANTATYSFDSLVNTSPSGGVPGLIEYCVYVSTLPTSGSAVAVGDNGQAFDFSSGGGSFAFSRHDGEPSNIPLNGTTGILMGSAQWSGAVPSSQSILLHISDSAECEKLYHVSSPSCFVFPSSGETPTPTNTPAGVPTPTNTPAGVPTPTNTPTTPGEPTATPTQTIPTPLPTPTGTLPPGK